MKKIVLYIFFILLCGNTFSQDSSCKALFSVTVLNPYHFQFTDESVNAKAWFWDFGDMSAINTQHPQKDYSGPGNYLVRLFIWDTLTNCSSNTSILLKVPADTTECKAGFDFEPRPGLGIQFKDTSSFPASSSRKWEWSFGDGEYSQDPNPLHIFPAAGLYIVCLDIRDTAGWCKNTYCDTVNVELAIDSCMADFNYDIKPGKEVVFSNLSYPVQNGMSYEWDFGDGSYSAEKNPTHTFLDNAVYKVCLNIIDSSGLCKDTTCFFIEIAGDPADTCSAGFVHADSTDRKIKFIHTCPNNYMFTWELGDGSIVNDPYPVHQYAKDSDYYVCLIVSDSLNSCSDTLCKTIHVKSGKQPYIEVIQKGEREIDSYIYPGSSNATLYLNMKNEAPFYFNLFDRTGRRVYTKENVQGNVFTFGTSFLANGLYLYQAYAEGEWITSGKFLIGIPIKE